MNGHERIHVVLSVEEWSVVVATLKYVGGEAKVGPYQQIAQDIQQQVTA